MDSSAAELALLDSWRQIEARFLMAALTQGVQLSIVTAKALAEGDPLNVEDLSDAWGLTPDQTHDL